MAIESFRELNRLRRAQNALQHLRAYAETRGMPDPDAAAREAVERVHAVGMVGEGGATFPAGEGQETRRSQTSGRTASRARGSTKSSTTRSRSAKSSGGGEVPRRLDDRTRDQLYARAQELDIDGRSSMSKEELIAAIRQKQ